MEGEMSGPSEKSTLGLGNAVGGKSIRGTRCRLGVGEKANSAPWGKRVWWQEGDARVTKKMTNSAGTQRERERGLG